MKLNVLINRVLDWPATKFEKWQKWLDEGRQKPELKKQNPFAKRCFLIHEAPRGGHRIIIGFDNEEDARDAYSAVADIRKIELTHNEK